MNRQCSDCEVALEPIHVLDATNLGGFGHDGGAHVMLHYAPVENDRNWFTGTVKGALPITGMICPQCRRISLFG